MTKLAVVIMFRDRPWSSGNDLIVTYVIKAQYMTSDNDYAADECREIQQTTKTFTNFPAAFSLQILILRSHLMRIFVMDLSSGPWLLYHVTRYNTIISAQVKYTHAVVYYQSALMHHIPRCARLASSKLLVARYRTDHGTCLARSTYLQTPTTHR